MNMDQKCGNEVENGVCTQLLETIFVLVNRNVNNYLDIEKTNNFKIGIFLVNLQYIIGEIDEKISNFIINHGCCGCD